MSMFFEAEFWVTVAFIIFFAGLVYLDVHKKLIDALDQRRTRIKAELDEARRLRDEAEQLVAEYRRKQKEAESEAEAIIANAKAEAERVAAETKAKLEDFAVRRARMAQTKIALAETQALADVRSAAAEAAVAAAEKILARTTTGKVADDLLAQGIGEIKTKLN
jgi:F-type H+-transporting ATPase subunit b